MAESVVFTTKNGNKNVSKQYNFVNPASADSDVAVAFVALGALSDNPIVDIQRVSKTSIDFAPPVGTQSPNLTLSSNSATVLWQQAGAKFYSISDYYFTFTRDGDGVVSATSNDSTITPTVSGNTVTLTFSGDGGAAFSATITVTCAATTDYAAQNATFTVNADAYSGGGTPDPTTPDPTPTP